MADVIETIRNRHSSRGMFDSGKPVSKDKLKIILDAARWAPTAHNMQNYEIIVIDDKQLIETIAGIESTISKEFILENFQQLSHSEEELRKKKVGILGAQFPPKWREASKLEEAIKERTPAPLSGTIRGGQTILIVLYDTRKRAPASEGDILGFLSLGCVMENIWLSAQSLGVSVHIMSAFNGVEKELRKMLGFPEYMGIGFTCKLGYPVSETDVLRVRRDIEDFTHHNKYGEKGLD
jgi:nitroreductase